MTTTEQIKVLCLRNNISISELARRIGQTPQNFSAKLKRNSMSTEELYKICELLNAKYEHFFVMENGEIIK